VKEMGELLRNLVSERMHFEEASYECDSMKEERGSVCIVL